MYVEDITIDGFKSYATRTVVPGFDSQFNAITGLNGSGKSNILDSICFVLGITNLSHVRHLSRCPVPGAARLRSAARHSNGEVQVGTG
jgi:structural maintenance of chromosome 2